MNTKLYGLDHLRALAITMVFLFHYFIISKGEPQWLPEVASFGWTGVDLFFVLSGFLIASQLFAQIKKEKAISLKLFFVKRAFRIIPAYLVTVAIYFCIPFFREKESLPPLVKFLTFTQNFNLNLKDFGTFSHAWSLCVEEHFYIILPLLIWGLLRLKLFNKSIALLVLFMVLGLVIRTYSFNTFFLPFSTEDNAWMYWYQFIYYPTYNRLDGLLVGVAIAALCQFQPVLWHKISKFGNSYVLLSLIFLTLAYYSTKDQMTYLASIWGYPIIALGYGLLVLGAISPSSFLYRWKSKTTTLLATLSYSVYLTHKGIIHITHEFLAGAAVNSNVVLIISMITSLAFAYAMHLLVEKPFMIARNKILTPKKGLN